MMHETISPDGWCNLRTAGPRTHILADSLAAAGLDVCAPAQVIEVRRPRSKITRERVSPIMPTLLFARASHLGELRRLRNRPISPRPGFSAFRHAGMVPSIADREIASLRALEAAEAEKRQAGLDREQRKRLKKQRHVSPIGERAHVPEGSFTGLTDVVQGGDGKFALICFGGTLQVKMATFLLRADPAEIGS
jgi:hypothetical protein